MITEGTVDLPTGQTIQSGQGGSYTVGSDRYPVTIIGWTKSGKTLFYQRAKATPTKRHNYFGVQDYTFEADSHPQIPS